MRSNRQEPGDFYAGEGDDEHGDTTNSRTEAIGLLALGFMAQQ